MGGLNFYLPLFEHSGKCEKRKKTSLVSSTWAQGATLQHTGQQASLIIKHVCDHSIFFRKNTSYHVSKGLKPKIFSPLTLPFGAVFSLFFPILSVILSDRHIKERFPGKVPPPKRAVEVSHPAERVIMDTS